MTMIGVSLWKRRFCKPLRARKDDEDDAANKKKKNQQQQQQAKMISHQHQHHQQHQEGSPSSLDLDLDLDLSLSLVSTTTTAIDLKLPRHLKPFKVAKFHSMWNPLPSQRLADAQCAGSKHKKLLSYAIGSASPDDQVYYLHDTGLFQCVHEAWMNHWNLRTTPEDWWYPVACQIAKAVSDAAKPGGGWNGDAESQRVRDLFVTHQGKETIEVVIPTHTIFEANYETVFAEFSSALQDKIKLPEYVTAMQSDFATTQLHHKIASQVNLMASVKEFFEYEMTLSGCGLKGVEMSGDQGDWDKLYEKICTLRGILKPIQENLEWRLPDDWWEEVSMVFQYLALTRKDPNDKRIDKFWSGIIMKTKDWEHGLGAYNMGPRTHKVDAYNGWLIKFLTKHDVVKVKDLQTDDDVQEQFSGLNQAPLEVTMNWCDPPISDEAQLVAGIMGFNMHDGDCTFNGVPSLQPYHMWAMMLPPKSKLRSS